MLLSILATLLVIAAAWYALTHPAPNGSVSSNVEDSAIRQVVTDFGTKLQTVSLLAPETDRGAAMESNYSGYVAPELIAAWATDSSQALGRTTSSPWPEKIDIVTVRPDGKDFIVEGNVIEVANTERGTAAAAVYPVTLTLTQRNGHWLIIKSVKGAYSELPQRQTIVGVWECLPHKDTTGPQTLECALGIAADGKHYAIDTRLMSAYPVDFPTGTSVRVTGIVTPSEQLNSVQKYDIEGVISATEIEKL